MPLARWWLVVMVESRYLSDASWAAKGRFSGKKIAPNMRALIILQHVAEAGKPISVTDLQRRMALPRPTLYRLVHTLVTQGYLQRDLDGHSFSPSALTRSLAVDLISTTRMRTVRLAVLRRLSEAIGETCNIAIPDRDGMQYLERYETSWPLRIQLPVGSKVPFDCTASGKVFLSSLRREQRQVLLRNLYLSGQAMHGQPTTDRLEAEIRLSKQQGYAVDYEEFVDGMLAIAVPVRGHHRRLLFTLSFHAPIQRMSLDRARGFVPLLKEAAKELRTATLNP